MNIDRQNENYLGNSCDIIEKRKLMTKAHRNMLTTLDKKISELGFLNVTPLERYKFVQLLIDYPALIKISNALSPSTKLLISQMSIIRRKSFAHVSKHILYDVITENKSISQDIRVSKLAFLPDSPKMLFVSPYEKSELKVGSFIAPPLGIHRIVNYLRLFGFRADVVDPNIDGEKVLLELINHNCYDVIGFSIYEPTIDNDIALAILANETSPNSLFVAGGEGAAYNKDKLLDYKNLFDIIFRGYGEFSVLDTMVLLYENQRGLKNFKCIEGLIIRQETKGILETSLPPALSNNEYKVISILFDTSIVPYNKYWDYMLSLNGGASVSNNYLDAVYTARLTTGTHCPMGCTFCSSTNFLDDSTIETMQKVRLLSAGDIGQILYSINKNHPDVRTIFFCDDDFMINVNRLEDLSVVVEKTFGKNRFRFIALGRIDRLKLPTLKRMKEVGFVQLNFGIEHFSDRILKDMNKHQTVEGNIAGLDYTLEAGIFPLINLILFYPTVNMEDVVQTIEHSVDFVEKGAGLSYWPYVEVFKGSSIINQVLLGKFETSFDSKFILPSNKEIKRLAELALKAKTETAREIGRRFNHTGRLPHVVDVLALFLAFYKLANIDVNRLLAVIEQKMKKNLF